jgi:RAB6A-GEF complex partner protein 2
MPGVDSYYEDSGIRVVVTPSQSSYFAGEPFSVTITFTNTRSIEAGPSKPHSHKRGSHSISSAPLARPPTSPGTPRTIAQPLPSQRGELPVRRGLVGKERAKDEEELPNLLEQRRKRLLGKSLSVSIAPHELNEQLGEGSSVKSASYAQSTFNTEQRSSMFTLDKLSTML